MGVKRQGILEGLRVLDLTRMLSGPYCTMMLADHGAEVIKIEWGDGDSSRVIGPYRTDDKNRQWSGYFVSLNRNKKSVFLNLKDEGGKQEFLNLVDEADVVIENFRPHVMEKLGLNYEILQTRKPAIVYAAIRGFGDKRSGKSPYDDWPSYDVVAQAMGGLMGITGPNASQPMKTGPGIGDIFTGMMMAFAILAALRYRDQTGEGQFIDIAMYDAMVSLCERIIYQYDYDKTIAQPQGNAHPLLAPFGIFPAKDGWVAIGVVENSLFYLLAKLISREDLIADDRFATTLARSRNADAINQIVSEWTAQYSRESLAGILGGKIPFGPVNNAADIFKDPHIQIRNVIRPLRHPESGHADFHISANPIKFSKTPDTAWNPPPRIGQHNADYLKGFAPKYEDKNNV